MGALASPAASLILEQSVYDCVLLDFWPLKLVTCTGASRGRADVKPWSRGRPVPLCFRRRSGGEQRSGAHCCGRRPRREAFSSFASGSGASPTRPLLASQRPVGDATAPPLRPLVPLETAMSNGETEILTSDDRDENSQAAWHGLRQPARSCRTADWWVKQWQ